MLYELGLTLCPYSIRHIIRMCLPGNYLTASGRESNLSYPSPSPGFVGAVRSEKISEAGHLLTEGRGWQASFTSFAQAASGTPPQMNLAVARPCTATFNFGL